MAALRSWLLCVCVCVCVCDTVGPGAPTPTDGAPSLSAGLSLLSLADSDHRGARQDGDDPASRPRPGSTPSYAGPSPAGSGPALGVVSPPAVTVFVGGIDGAIEGDHANGDANVGFSETESQLGAPAPAPAALADGAAGEAQQ